MKVDFGLKWRSDAKLEKKKYGLYKVDKTPKSTYYDKWGSSSSWTEVAKGTRKLERFFSQQDGSMQESISSDEDEVFILIWSSEDIVLNLERDLKENFNRMLAKEYVKKRAIFEYLVYLLKGEKKMKASINVVNVIYNSNSKSIAT